METIGKSLIFFGILLILLGLILSGMPQLLSWFGKLPGDIHIKDDQKVIFIPITSMLLLSLILTVVLNLLTFFLRK